MRGCVGWCGGGFEMRGARIGCRRLRRWWCLLGNWRRVCLCRGLVDIILVRGVVGDDGWWLPSISKTCPDLDCTQFQLRRDASWRRDGVSSYTRNISMLHMVERKD